MKRIWFFIFVISFTLCACIKNNPEPAWLEINEWTLEENLDVEEGELTHNFSEVYLTIDDNIIGYFELPIKIPILLEGSHTIKVYPAIKNNGISATKKVYPFCKPMEISATLEKGKTLEINPITSYYSETKFWIEDFENTIFNIDDNNPYSLAIMNKGNDPTKLEYGNFYGEVLLNSTDSMWFGKTTPPLTLPKGAADVYLEIDYRNTNTVLTGVNSITNGSITDNPHIQLNSQDKTEVKWKKIYIDLKEIVSFYVNASGYELYFKALLDSGLSSSEIQIDNIKVVHF